MSKEFGAKEMTPPRVRETGVSRENGYDVHHLQSEDGRRLDVSIFTERIYFGDPNASTFINGRYEDTKKPGSTTELYREAQKLMQDTADALGEPVTYQFNTLNERMKSWAATKGDELFHWENPHTVTEYEPLELTANIKPQRKKM